jgi:hypothetical protein
MDIKTNKQSNPCVGSKKGNIKIFKMKHFSSILITEVIPKKVTKIKILQGGK